MTPRLDLPGSSTSVFGLPIAHASAWIFNCYVIDTGDGLAVVDPGLPLVARRALELIARGMDRTPADVGVIQCTHAHPDHVGGVSTLTSRTEGDVYLPHRCEAYLAGERPRTFPLVESSVRFMPVWGEQRFSFGAFGEFLRLGRKVGFGGPPDIRLDFEPDGFVDHGDAVPGAEGWGVIHAPGHTDDSTCFYHRDSATLISGDAVVTHDGRAWFNPEYVDSTAARDTEELLRSVQVRHLLPGHGEPITASDVWRDARSFDRPPAGTNLLARCSRRFGRWGASAG